MPLAELRSGLSDCDGLEAKYERAIRPRVAKLAGSPDPAVRLQAEQLLKEGLWWQKRLLGSLDDENVFAGITCQKGKSGQALRTLLTH